MMTMLLVVGLLLIGLGALIGSSWTVQALEGRFRHHAAERRRLNEEWSAVRAYRAQQRRCVDCEDELDLYRRPALVTGALDDD
ncbi:MAG: hypothetical protein GEU83_03595 [Pseudonocardiaceae bacterium]|nr:hypothetical protein [Pseudonocardiaceae bacterium]